MTTAKLLDANGAVNNTVLPAYTFQRAVEDRRDGASILQVTQLLLSELNLGERLSLLDGDVPFYQGLRDILCDRYNRKPFVMGEIARLGIPGIRFTDGPRGVVMGSSTSFPVSMARAATWDTSLERRVGEAIGLEARAQGANYFAGVCVNLPRHPAWGRIQETYGEDPILLGEFGLALVQGVQNHVMACVKHFALNSMENARFRVDVQVEENVLHEVYLPHFRQIVEGGVASVMSSYNSVNGEWAGQSRLLLTDILRHEYKFDGFVLSDFIFGLRDAATSLQNGLDIEAPFQQQRRMDLKKVCNIEQSVINASCTRILTKQIEFAASCTAEPDVSTVFCSNHRSLAREVAGRSIVLLKNEAVDGAPLLPLSEGKAPRIGVVGRLANSPNTGDKGSSQVFSPHVVTPIEGLRAALPNASIIFDDSDSVEKALEIAKMVDLVICIVGYSANDEGEYVVPSLQTDSCLSDLLPPAHTEEERATLRIIRGEKDGDLPNAGIEVGAGGDRRSLRLRSQDTSIMTAVAAANPSTVISIVGAGAIIMEEWIEKIPALVMSWYAGSSGGHGLADVLLGRVDASGRLPFSIPKDESHLPFFDIDAQEISYDRWHGQALLDKLGEEARFPFGFGLSFTKFHFSNLRHGLPVPKHDDRLSVHVNVTNDGSRHGRQIVQVYGLPDLPDFPSRVLLGFVPVDLAGGEVKDVTVDVSLRPLQRWVDKKFILPGKEIGIEVGAWAGDPNALQVKMYL